MIARGELYSASLDPVVGSEQGGIRPVLIIQNDVGNRYSPTVIVLAVTGQLGKARLPTHVNVPAQGNGLAKDSVVLAEQIRTLDKRRLRERIGTLSPELMEKVSEAVKISLGFDVWDWVRRAMTVIHCVANGQRRMRFFVAGRHVLPAAFLSAGQRIIYLACKSIFLT